MADASTRQKVKWQKQMAKSLNDIYDHCFGLAQDPALKKDPTIAKDPSCNQAAFRQHASDITAQMTWLNSEISTTSTAFVKAASDELKVHVAKVNDRAQILTSIAYTVATLNDFLVLVDQSAAIAAGVMH